METLGSWMVWTGLMILIIAGATGPDTDIWKLLMIVGIGLVLIATGGTIYNWQQARKERRRTWYLKRKF